MRNSKPLALCGLSGHDAGLHRPAQLHRRALLARRPAQPGSPLASPGHLLSVREGGRFPEGGVFVNNGDGHYSSGGVSRDSFPVKDGLTIEAWGRMPFSGSYYEAYTLGLLSELPASDSAWRVRKTMLAGKYIGHSRTVYIYSPNGTDDVPIPDDVETWRQCAFQIDPNGTVSLIVDGQLHWRSPWQVTIDGPVHVGVLGSALNREIAHGSVRVCDRRCYSLPSGRR